jgi:hypothetical protein
MRDQAVAATHVHRSGTFTDILAFRYRETRLLITPLLGSAPTALIGIALYTGQLFFSRTWLRRYRFGPVEWLWRSLTYGRCSLCVAASPPSDVPFRYDLSGQLNSQDRCHAGKCSLFSADSRRWRL